MPEFFEKRYGSKNIKLVSVIVIFLFLIPYSASVYNGLSSLFAIVFGIPGWVVMVLLAVLTAVYLFFGGYFATALSDFVQGIIMLFGVVFMVIVFMNHNNVSWDLSALANDVNKTWFTFKSDNIGLYGSTVSLISLILLTSFGVWGLPQTIHKYYAIRDKKAITQGVIVSTIFALIIGFGAYFVGALAGFFPEYISDTTPSDQIIPILLSKIIPSGFMGVIVVLILSASMSTLASVSLASASVVAVDIYKGRINTGASDKRVNVVMRSLCLVFILVSVVIAIINERFNVTAIAYMMGISWGTLSGCFIGPFVLGLLWKRVTKNAVWASIISSLSLTAILIVFFGYHQNYINGVECSFGNVLTTGVGCSPMIGVICMIFSIVITVVVSLLTKAPSDEILHESFEKPIENEIK